MTSERFDGESSLPAVTSFFELFSSSYVRRAVVCLRHELLLIGEGLFGVGHVPDRRPPRPSLTHESLLILINSALVDALAMSLWPWMPDVPSAARVATHRSTPMPRATFRTIASSIKRTATWVACLALLMLPGVAFVQEPEFRSLQTYRPENNYMRHAGFLGRIGQTKTGVDARDAKFRRGARACRQELRFVRSRPTSGITISNTPSSESCWPSASMSRNSARTRPSASSRGCAETNRSGIDSMSFRSFNFPDRYIRHRDFELWLDPFENTPLFRDDATFFMVSPPHVRCHSRAIPYWSRCD